MATVFLPYALRKYADGAERVDVPAKNLGELVDNLEAAYPVSWTGPSFTAGDASATVQSLELAHHGITLSEA